MDDHENVKQSDGDMNTAKLVPMALLSLCAFFVYLVGFDHFIASGLVVSVVDFWAKAFGLSAAPSLLLIYVNYWPTNKANVLEGFSSLIILLVWLFAIAEVLLK
ncbi:TPA: hypothetical protein ACN326_004731 [Vibrio parahaemolyticus]